MKPSFMACLVMLVVLVYYIRSSRRHRQEMRYLAEEPDRDPYLEQVRAMRSMPGAKPDAAVSIQDQETGEFFYYPRGSETRMVRNEKNARIYIDWKSR